MLSEINQIIKDIGRIKMPKRVQQPFMFQLGQLKRIFWVDFIL